ncbi:MFS transporter, DHA1 family, bicyclomycin/chloramphenicol resistance protein [Paraglaciecola agarilytica NO2]|uniref:Bcr/CflA family efflux transporter n=2 Tax=Paraglaciecola chathamensis TaxID=368405 RepID=A0ABQ0I354_9ALTE|nr:MFS transporter, DHA1 family, bicyclomycin/chloramphenicol resistance protein [Paraglaciecola agarilytica NO2]
MGLIGGLMSATGPLSVTLLTPAFPVLIEVFSTSSQIVTGSVTMFFVGFATAHLICGTLSDGLGRRNVGVAFFSLYVLAGIVLFLVQSIEALLWARLLQGVGASAGISIARALARDLFEGQQSARVVNIMYIVIGTAPAIAPILGSVLLIFFGYRSLFALMILHGLAIIAFLIFLIPNSVKVDMQRLRFRLLIRNFCNLLGSRDFMLSTLAISGVSGALYGQAAIVPFLLMSELGLTPYEFGLIMLVHAGFHIAGSFSAKFWLGRFEASKLVPLAQTTIAVSAVWLFIAMMSIPPSTFNVIGPLSLAAFGAAHSYPTFITAGFRDFPQIAGAAASFVGFMQMGTGFAVGLVASLIGAPAVALGLVVATSLLIASFSGILWFLPKSLFKET